MGQHHMVPQCISNLISKFMILIVRVVMYVRIWWFIAQMIYRLHHVLCQMVSVLLLADT